MALAHARISEATERLSSIALVTFFRIAGLWGLTALEQRTLLGSIPESTFYKWVKGPQSARLQRDQLDRVSHLLGIYKSINILLPRPESADKWVRRPNDAALFKGASALDYMLAGGLEHIVDVRRYLDSERGW
ncbi:MAG: MbcA/ParS/Xre antitoxin family protein [Candidatus Eremiobacteraeota bacterium]|nr:MbcA/ParS/Xre antitoxin family protein [Candidatus Eremiobacteraeota bacterium]